MAKYSYITDKTHNNRKIQVESAKRDGSGKNFENNYAKQNGNYQSLTAGLSNNFDTKKVMVDESAYNFRQTATIGSVELEVGSPCKVKKIVGGSVAFNQLVQPQTIYNSSNNIRITSNNDYVYDVVVNDPTGYRQIELARFNSVSGHKYLVKGNKKTASNVGIEVYLYGHTTPSNNDYIVNCNLTSSDMVLYLFVYQNTPNGTYKVSPNLIDLTQMFGSTIADYIYSLEQANAGSGVAWFKRYFPKEYYAYNSGELVSVKTQGKKITHFNQWDEEVKTGYYLDGTTGQEVASQNAMCSKNFCECMPNTSYYFRTSFVADATPVYFYDKDKNYISRVYVRNNVFTTPINAWYMRISFALAYGTTYKHDICINFHYDGERDGEYEPYNSETYPCDDIELRGIPQLDENNNLAFDGDEYANDGNVKRKYGTYTFVNTDTFYVQSADYHIYRMPINDMKAVADISSVKGLMDLYVQNTTQGIGVLQPDNSFTIYNGTLYIRDNSCASASDLVTKLVGHSFIYELATQTNENSIPFTEVQECDNWGTEEWLAPTTDTRPCEVPVGHETDYLPDLKAKVEVAPNTPNENGVYVMEHNASGNSYTPIATWLQANGYVNEISANAIKENIGGALRHQLAQATNIDFNNTAWLDLGSLSWSHQGDSWFTATAPSGMKGSGNNEIASKILCSIYKTSPYIGIQDLQISLSSNGAVVSVKNTNYIYASTFKNAMKGVLLAYEKAS